LKMPYTYRFRATDDLIAHLQTVLPTIADPQIEANYAGFLSVSGVTVYELAIKDIFCEFALKKHLVFGAVIERHFKRINGMIGLDDLKGKHVNLFGEKYLKKFKKKLQDKENSLFATSRISISANYGNLITCRHKYVHTGSPTLTINEVIGTFQSGKEVIHCLSEAMRR